MQIKWTEGCTMLCKFKHVSTVCQDNYKLVARSLIAYKNRYVMSEYVVNCYKLSWQFINKKSFYLVKNKQSINFLEFLTEKKRGGVSLINQSIKLRRFSNWITAFWWQFFLYFFPLKGYPQPVHDVRQDICLTVSADSYRVLVLFSITACQYSISRWFIWIQIKRKLK